MAILTTVVVGITAKIVADEAKAWLPSLSQRLLKFAVSRLPEELRERYTEEWTADLLSYPGEISRCFRTLGMCWAGLRIRKYSDKTLVNIVVEKMFWWLFGLYLRLMTRWINRMTEQRLRLNAARALPATEQGVSEQLPPKRLP